jgi:hypothetical protein
MTREDQVFITDVVVIDLTWEMVALSVISQPASVATKLSAIVNIHTYKGFHEGHHFIPMAMECTAHSSVIWIVSSGSVPVFSTIDD